jgi:hypothetical protein
VSYSSPTPLPERKANEFISRDVDQIAKIGGLPPLKMASLAQADTEIRIWYGLGLFPLEGFAMKRTGAHLTAFHLKAYDYYQFNRATLLQLAAPKSGWEACWQRLINADVLNLPSGTESPDPDAQGFYVEVMNNGSYRNYQYNSPEYSESPNAKRMLAIGDIISDEFGLKRFHVTKSSQ